jgi:dipeptidyl aminopeptidase/acylaminoacyl peptidase
VLAFVEQSPAGSAIWILPRGGEPSAWLGSSFYESNPNFSPDGRWLAYVSDESGRSEVWLQSYPEPGTKVRVSTDGGREPVWSPDGTELFYRQGAEALMAVGLTMTPELSVERPRLVLQENLNDERGWANYDISPDGRRFVVIHDFDVNPPSLVVVENWFDELQRLVPTP